jgi:glycosyltransferase involved in cell wall biosynthesis
MRFFYRRAEHRIAVSRGAAEDVAKLAGLPASAVEVVYNPIDFPEVIGRTSLSEQVWQFGSPRIVTAGSLKAEKNHPLLLRAFALLLKHHPEARLLILGEGSLRLRLEALCDELGLGQRVSLPGFQLDLWPFLASADLFVLSSDYEGMSLVIVEAMHAGLRVVSTDCEAGPAELLDNGRYGRLVPVGDVEALARAMIAELATPKNAERQRARAREITGPSNLQRYEELLTS